MSSNTFYDIAKMLMCDKHLVITNNDGVNFMICEVEMYLKSDEHPDEYTHCSEEQKTNGFIYFHKYRNETYKSGTYKGMDITFGNGVDYFGILIRAVVRLDELPVVIDGPCKVVNEILRIFDCSDVKQFVAKRPQPYNVYDSNSPIQIVDVGTGILPSCIYSGARIGLSDKYPIYRDKKYRFVRDVMVNGKNIFTPKKKKTLSIC